MGSIRLDDSLWKRTRIFAGRADAEDGDAEIRHKVCRVEMTG